MTTKRKIEKYQNSGSTGYSWSQGQTNGNTLVPATRSGEARETQKDINKRQEEINRIAKSILDSKGIDDFTEDDLVVLSQSTVPDVKNVLRDYRINRANKAQEKDGAWSTAEGFKESTAAVGDKLSLQRLPGVGQYIPDVLDVTGGIGQMAAGLGAIPSNIQQGEYGQAALNIGLPLLTGALSGLGTTTRGQFINNLVNPFAGLETNFKSEINWAKWNKEIPKNKSLLQEYNTIEQITKSDGTWMKSPDGSEFKGTPEQFVQQNSENFKKAFSEGFNNVYRGASSRNVVQQMDPEKGVFTANRELANKYISNSGRDNILTSSSKFNTDKYTTELNPEVLSGIFNLAHRKSKNSLELNFNKNNWADLPLKEKIKAISDEREKFSEYMNKAKDVKLNHPDFYLTVKHKIGKSIREVRSKLSEYKNIVENDPELLKKLRDELGDNTTTDSLAKYIEKYGIDNIKLNNIYDGGLGDVTIVNHKKGNYLKSLVGNNGMFDMNNPNIYKSLMPILLGAAASFQQNKEQVPQNYQQGGATIMKRIKKNKLEKYQNGSAVDFIPSITNIFSQGLGIAPNISNPNGNPFGSNPFGGQLTNNIFNTGQDLQGLFGQEFQNQKPMSYSDWLKKGNRNNDLISKVMYKVYEKDFNKQLEDNKTAFEQAKPLMANMTALDELNKMSTLEYNKGLKRDFSDVSNDPRGMESRGIFAKEGGRIQSFQNSGAPSYPYLSGAQNPPRSLFKDRKSEPSKIKNILDNILEAVGINTGINALSDLSKKPGLDTFYDLYNVLDAYRQGDPIKATINELGALVPGLSGKVIEAAVQDYIPKIPDDAKKKMKFILKQSSYDNMKLSRKYETEENGLAYWYNPQFQKDYKDEIDKLQLGGAITQMSQMPQINQLQQALGYKDSSPYKNLPFQTINSNSITMDGVSQPLLAIADNGERRVMQPNSGLHNFQGANSVMEVPMAQNGMATTLDSLMLYNNSRDKSKFYKNNKNYKSGKVKDVYTTTNKDIDGIFKNFSPQIAYLLNEDAKVQHKWSQGELSSTDNRFKVVNDNLIQLGDILSGKPDDVYATNSPKILLHRNIKPSKWDTYSTAGGEDITNVPYYDPALIVPEHLAKTVLSKDELIRRRNAQKGPSRMESIKKRNDSPIIEPRQPRPNININQIDTIDPQALSMPQRYVESLEIDDPNFTSGEMIKPYEGIPNLNVVFKERRSDGQLVPVFIENEAGERVPYNSQLKRNFQYRKKEDGGQVAFPILNLSGKTNPLRLNPQGMYKFGGLITEGSEYNKRKQPKKNPISGASSTGPMGPKDIPSYDSGIRAIIDQEENEIIPTDNLIPIQTEIGELIILPTGDVVPVMAKKRHKQMEEDEVTDIAPEGAYILSAHGRVKIKKDEADRVITETGIKPYRLGQGQDKPTEKTLADMMNKKEMSPADVGRVVSQKFPVVATSNPYEAAANTENKINRKPYLEGLIQLSEFDKMRKGIDTQSQEIVDDVPHAQAGLAIGLGTALLQGITGLFGASAQKKDAQRAYADVLRLSQESAAKQRGQLGLGAAAGIMGTLGQDPRVNPLVLDPTFIRQMETRTPQQVTDAIANQAYANMPDYRNLPANQQLMGSQAAYAQALKAAGDNRLAAYYQDRGARNQQLTSLQGYEDKNRQERETARRATTLNTNQMIGNVGDRTQGYFDSSATIEANLGQTQASARLGQSAANQQAIRAYTQGISGAIGTAGATAYDYYANKPSGVSNNPNAGYGSGIGPGYGGVGPSTPSFECIGGQQFAINLDGSLVRTGRGC